MRFLKKKLLGLFASLLFLGACDSQPKQLDWLFIYYMPYDNDLSVLGEEIIGMLQKGSSYGVGAVVAADFADSSGMKYYTIMNGRLTEKKVEQERSGKAESFEDYLKWVDDNFSFDRSMISLLDHGGGVDELCLDLYPIQEFLHIDEAADVIERFNEKQGKAPELLFLQVCSKGNIESLYEFRNCAPYTLFSQTELGAPNYYYEQTLKSVAAMPDYTGSELAELIALRDEPRMYNSYTCIENSALDSLALVFSDYLSKLSKDSFVYRLRDLAIYNYAGTDYWDLVSFMEATDSLGKETGEVEYWMKKLIKFNIKNEKVAFIKDFSGLSIWAPWQDKTKRYEHLDFFSLVDYPTLSAQMRLK